MGVLPVELASDLRAALRLERAIETGTYLGSGTRRLAAIFPRVDTIEVQESLAAAAQHELFALAHVTVHQGSSRDVLPRLVDPAVPTLYWLDGHWSGGVTGGAGDQCPVLGELEAAAGGHADDCILIDDARLFLAPPPPPHDVSQWPTYEEIASAVRAARPEHHVIVAHDTIVAVPRTAAAAANAYAHARPPMPDPLPLRVLRRLRAQARRQRRT